MDYEIADLLRMTPDELDTLAEELENENHHEYAGLISRYAKHVRGEQEKRIESLESATNDHLEALLATGREYRKRGLNAEANMYDRYVENMRRKLQDE